MFFEYVKKQYEYENGNVRVGLPALGHGDKVYLSGKGLVGIAASFLSKDEKQWIAVMSMEDAKRDLDTSGS